MPLTFLKSSGQVSCRMSLNLGLSVTDLETELTVAGGGRGWGDGIVREFGMDMCTLVYLKWITNKDPLVYLKWITHKEHRNSAQYNVAAWMEGSFGGEWIHVYVWLSLFAVHLKLSQHCFFTGYTPIWASLVAQMVKNLPAMWETQVWSLGQEDPLEKSLATHSCILVWRIPWTEEPGRPQSIRSQRVEPDWATNTLTCHTPIQNKTFRKFWVCLVVSHN